MARAAQQRIDDFSAQGLANTAEALAKAGQLDVELFAALAEAAEQHMVDFNTKDLADTAWAFAIAGIKRPKLMQKFGKAASVLIGQFDPEYLLKFR